MTDPYLSVLIRAKQQAKVDVKEIRRLRRELGECKALVGRYRAYFREKFSRKKNIM